MLGRDVASGILGAAFGARVHASYSVLCQSANRHILALSRFVCCCFAMNGPRKEPDEASWSPKVVYYSLLIGSLFLRCVRCFGTTPHSLTSHGAGTCTVVLPVLGLESRA